MDTKKKKLIDSVFEKLRKGLGDEGAFIAIIKEDEKDDGCHVKGEFSDPSEIVRCLSGICLDNSPRSRMLYVILANAVASACLASEVHRKLFARIKNKQKKAFEEFKEELMRHEKGSQGS